jgi:hypothetical protein
MVRKIVASVCSLIFATGIALADASLEAPLDDTSVVASTIQEISQWRPEVVNDVPQTPEKPTGMDPIVRRIYVSMIQPETNPTIAPNGGFVVSSVASYDVNDQGVKPISCSFIARQNLAQLLDAFRIHAPKIAQWDANDLIRFGRTHNTLTSFTPADLIAGLNVRRDSSEETVFDIYRHVASRSHALQGHRATVFLWEDDLWYILDPIDGEKIVVPQLLSIYLDNDVENAEWLVRFPGFSRNVLEPEHLATILPFFSPELQLFLSPEYLTFTDSNNSEQVVNDGIDLLMTSATA